MKNIPVEINGLLRSLVSSALLCIIAAILIYCTNLSEMLMIPVGKAIIIFSVFYGACYVSKTYSSKGLIRGLFMGMVFFIVIVVITLCIGAGNVTVKSTLLVMITCLLAGGLGGILGIGLSDKAI